jgi:hypothetical protein
MLVFNIDLNRINGTVDLYRRTTKDLLLYTQNPSSSDSQIMTIIILEQLKIKESVC